MNITYFLQLDERDDSHCRWMRFNGRVPVGSMAEGTLDDALENAQGQSVVIMVPGTDVSLATVDVVSKNRRQLAAAIPYMLEEDLAEDVEELHFSLHDKTPEGGQLCSIVSRKKIEPLFDAVRERGFQSVSVLPVSLCIPVEQGEWTLFVDDRTAIVRTTPGNAIAVDTELAVPVLASLIGERQRDSSAEDESKPVIRLYDFRQSDTGALAGGEDLDAVITPAEIPRGEAAALVLAATRWFDACGSINLLQGDYLIDNQISGYFRKWQLAASLAAVSLVLVLVSKGIDNLQLAGERDLLDQQIEALYLEAFPGEIIEGNPVGEMRSRLSKLKGSNSAFGEAVFLPLVALGGKHLAVARESKIVNMRFRNTALEIDIETNSIDVLEELQQKISAGVVNVELKSVTSSGGKVRGRLLLSMEEKA